MTEKSKTLLRMEQSLHEDLKILASNEKRSLNSYIVNILEDHVEENRDNIKEIIFNNIKTSQIYGTPLSENEKTYLNEYQSEYDFYLENERVMTMEDRMRLLKAEINRDPRRKLGTEGMSRDEEKRARSVSQFEDIDLGDK